MSKFEKLFTKIMKGTSDRNIPFNDLRYFLDNIGFAERIKGDHHIYTRDGVEEIINIQPINSMAKPYQVKQIHNIVLKYRLGAGHDDEV